MHRVRLTCTLTAIALALPAAAAARPIDFAGDRLSLPPTPTQPTVTSTPDDHFDWASAAIGAGGASALLLLTAGVARHRDGFLIHHP